jgi:hypothetical protein
VYRLISLAVLLAGCGFTPGAASDATPRDGQLVDDGRIDGTPSDGTVDAAIDAPAGTHCYGGGLVQACLALPPSTPLSLVGQFDTDLSPLCALQLGGNAGADCVVAGTAVTVNSQFVAFGTRPLVVVSTSTIKVLAGGTIDAASHRIPFRLGPGADAASCTAGTAPTAGGSGGGGYGGTFGSKGGDGNANDGGTAGLAAAVGAAPTTLRGGCPGSDGAGSALTAGHGGGAVYLIATTSITIDGQINTSGSGGGGGNQGDRGGGGGGSGGMIGLDAPMVLGGGTGKLIANGGGGGEGEGNNKTGNPGADPSSVNAAPGGKNASMQGGDGGDGSAGAGNGGNGKPGDPNGGGAGGGGGGGGVLVVTSANKNFGGLSSPPLP